MTSRNNIINVLNNKKSEWIPNMLTDSYPVGFMDEFEKGRSGGGYDGFGVYWVVTKSGGGAPVPEPNRHVLNNISDWEKAVTFPDLESIDWIAKAKKDLEAYDPVNQVLNYESGNGQFERFITLMGFENGLCAFYEEPDACYELLEAITDYKIKLVEKVAKYYKADLFTNFDDVAYENGMFISKEMYQKLISPQHKRLNDAVRANGMMPLQHCCGKAENLIEDFIDEGAVAWTIVQPLNDIVSLLNNYGDKICIIGGFDSNGAPRAKCAPEQLVRTETRRAIMTYGKYSGYIFDGFLIVDSLSEEEVNIVQLPLRNESIKLCRQN